MQITVEIPDEIGKRFSKAERGKIIKETFKEKIKKSDKIRTPPQAVWHFKEV